MSGVLIELVCAVVVIIAVVNFVSYLSVRRKQVLTKKGRLSKSY